MSSISNPTVIKDATIADVSVSYRVFFESGGTGLSGLTLALKVFGPDEAEVTPLTENTHWVQSEVDATDAKGEYTLSIIIPGKLATLGHYSVVIDSQDPGAGKLVGHLTMNGIYSLINDAAPTTTGFVTDLTSAVDDFYNDSLILFIDGALAGSGPRKVTDYVGSTKAITVKALPSAPADNDPFYLIRY